MNRLNRQMHRAGITLRCWLSSLVQTAVTAIKDPGMTLGRMVGPTFLGTSWCLAFFGLRVPNRQTEARKEDRREKQEGRMADRDEGRNEEGRKKTGRKQGRGQGSKEERLKG